MPAVSVIVPVYKVEPYIARCARSLFGQTLKDIEYIFIDDCTPDRSIEVLREVLEEYPERKEQVRIFRMPENGGQAESHAGHACQKELEADDDTQHPSQAASGRLTAGRKGDACSLEREIRDVPGDG